jgi:hypothetical protein
MIGSVIGKCAMLKAGIASFVSLAASMIFFELFIDYLLFFRGLDGQALTNPWAKRARADVLEPEDR